MDQYPLFRFAQPGTLPYWWLEQEDPALFEQIRARVREGRWEVAGGTWTDTDCALPGGEPLVRQFLYGKRYLRDRLGVEVRLAWVPESLGYNWNLPQILRKAGIDYFLTAQLAWNDTNAFPYHLFWWEAPDGSCVLCYFPFAGPGGPLQPDSIINQAKALEQETRYRDVLVLFGGTTPLGLQADDLQRAAQLKKREIFPRLSAGQACEWFERIPAQVKQSLPVWRDELYLECDREAYTARAAIKTANRSLETLLNEAERWSCAASLLGHLYPAQDLREAWTGILGSQSRAALAGIGMTPLYLATTEAHERTLELAQSAQQQALRAIAAKVNTANLSSPLLVFNSLSCSRSEVVQTEPPGPGHWHILNEAGGEVPSQMTQTDQGEPLLLFLASDVPPLGYRAFQLLSGEPRHAPEGKVRATKELIENEFLEVRVDPRSGELSSIFDKQGQQQVLTLGQSGNQLHLLEELPRTLRGGIPGRDSPYSLVRHVEAIHLLENGPLRATIRIIKTGVSTRGKRSRYTQDIVLTTGARRLDIRNSIDWHEENRLLKAVFPVGLISKQATYEMPYAAVTRPTTMDTPWEKARWEVPVHKWADLSDTNRGVSLLNDSKYGMDIHEGLLRLTLLRGATDTDPIGDRGLHQFVYSIYPHPGDWRQGTIREANQLNSPLLWLRTTTHHGPLPPVHSFFSLDADNVVLEAVKQAERGDALVLRLVEYYGSECAVAVRLPLQPKRATLVNLLEDEQETLPAQNPLSVPVRRYEIVSVKVQF